jgi:hypothetical protein
LAEVVGNNLDLSINLEKVKEVILNPTDLIG